MQLIIQKIAFSKVSLWQEKRGALTIHLPCGQNFKNIKKRPKKRFLPSGRAFPFWQSQNLLPFLLISSSYSDLNKLFWNKSIIFTNIRRKLIAERYIYSQCKIFAKNDCILITKIILSQFLFFSKLEMRHTTNSLNTHTCISRKTSMKWALS